LLPRRPWLPLKGTSPLHVGKPRVVGGVGDAPFAGSLSDVWVALTAAVAWGAFAAGSVPPNDLWWHLRAGEWILAHGTIPRVDLFSYTQVGSPWIYQAWLAEVFLAWLHGLGGVALLVAVGAALNVLGYGLTFGAALVRTRGHMRVAALATLLGMIVGTAAWQVRPQLLSVPLFGGLLAALSACQEDDPRVPGAMWALPLGFVLWANLHGGFVFGLAALGIYVVARIWRWVCHQGPFPWRWAILGTLCVAATLVTPLGLGMGSYVLGFARHPVTRNLNMEFAPISARDPVGIVFLLHLALLVGLWLWQGYRPTTRETLLLVVFAGLTFVAVRGVLWYGLVTTPMMARALAATPMFSRSRAQRRGVVWLNRLLIGFLALTVVATCPWLRGYLPHPAINPAHPYLGEDTPVEAVDALRRLARAGEVRPFHSEAYGSYLIYAAPEVPVFVDTRIELYPPEQWSDYIAANVARYDWYERLQAYGVNVLLLDKERQPDLVEAVEANATGAWEQVYEDERAVIFQLRPSAASRPEAR